MCDRSEISSLLTINLNASRSPFAKPLTLKVLARNSFDKTSPIATTNPSLLTPAS
ncbi:MAG: hypothetical protein WBA89_24635 [Microcoleus sp.]|uniref:hypothetical protein n=1 Tax=Microcoleus sp. TaxID=44472 RepID=UPI003C74E021